MKYQNQTWIRIILLAIAILSLTKATANEKSKMPLIDFTPNFVSKAGNSGRDLVEEYLSVNSAKFGIKQDLSDLEFAGMRPSLGSVHYRFTQKIEDIVISNAEVIVSLDNTTGQIYRSFVNTIVVDDIKPPKKSIDEKEAYEIAWTDLAVTGSLFHDPRAEKVYVDVDGKALLAWEIHLPVTMPYGYCVYRLNASDGSVISFKDYRIHVAPKNSKLPPEPGAIPSDLRPLDSAPSHDKKLFTDRQAEFERWFRLHPSQGMTKTQPNSKTWSNIKKADGQAKVFDPDPRTTLFDSSLQDQSDAKLFESAYKDVTLRDISFDGSQFVLRGPWVVIEDFDPPVSNPSTSPTGRWTSLRGNGAFNDAMTYYHIDKNQRYLQTLGFVRDKGVQEGPIRIDANGANGADNSYYQPSTNTLSFGWGCVDDNEDADVILHEYGHAIQHGINASWSGGDTGAMGEGFADYWAASYSYKTPNGSDYKPEEVFSWDGQGDGSQCWSGRILNATSLIYDHARNYAAHQTIENGRQSDELWSTPLFQSLLALLDQGVPHRDVDQIVIEAHFGLGSGLKMRDLARATVQTASRLFPNGPHAAVFTEKFTDQNILEVPRVELVPTIRLTEAGSNGVADPGETFQGWLILQNSGTLAAHEVNAKGYAGQYLEVLSGQTEFKDIDIGQRIEGLSPLLLKIPSTVTCGSTAALNIDVTFNQGSTSNLAVGIPTGIAKGGIGHKIFNTPIPDKDPKGIDLPIDVVAGSTKVSNNLKIHLNIAHTYSADLVIKLVSPQGKTVILHQRKGGSGDNIKGIYPDSLVSEEPLTNLIDEPLSGTWRLQVADHAIADLGSVHSWGLEDIEGYVCQ